MLRFAEGLALYALGGAAWAAQKAAVVVFRIKDAIK